VQLLLLIGLCGFASKAETQVVLLAPAYRFAASVSVGGTAEVGSATINISRTGSLSAINVVTQGIPNQDFTLAAGGSCTVGTTYFAGQTCTVAISFQPKYPGVRQGAVVLVAGDSSMIGSELLNAACTGATLVMVPEVVINTIAGNGSWIYRGDGMRATWAQLYLPMGGAADAAGNVFISDSGNNRIRRVDGTTQIISTAVGSGSSGFGGDGGLATSAMLSIPSDVKLDGAGNLYIADSSNHAVRMVNATTGIIQTIAGTGGHSGYSGDGGPATQAHLNNPNGLAFDGDHSLYISDTGNNVIRKVDLATGTITTVAGTGTGGFSGDGSTATSGQLNSPWQIALGNDGSLYIADLENNRIRKLSPIGVISTIAGTGELGFSGDNGPAIAAQLNVPAGVAVDAAGDVFIADSGNSLVREVNVNTGIISSHSGTLSGYSDGGAAAPNSYYYDGPYGLFFDSPGNLYVSDMFHQVVRQLPAASVVIFFSYEMKEGEVSPPRPVIIENDGNAPLAFSALQAVIYTALDPATTTCQVSQPLASGASCTLGVEAAPTTTGNYLIGTVAVESNAADKPSSLCSVGAPPGQQPPPPAPASICVYSVALAVDPTLAVLTSNPNPAAFGTAVTFRASVTTSGTTPPSGTVSFLDGSVPIGTATVNASGVAAFSTTSLTAGLHSITAIYSGDEQNATATSAVLIENVEQATTTTMVASPNPSTSETSVTFTATVAGPSGSNFMPSGTVAFYDGTLALGAGSMSATGVATFSISSLSSGTHNITAGYSGDTKSFASQSTAEIQTVNQSPTKTSLSTSNISPYAGVSTTFSSVVSRTDGIIPTGVVTFLDGTVSIGAATLDATGTAAWTVTGLTSGTHSISAAYAGDGNDLTSTSSVLAETVQQVSTSTTLAASVNPANAGAALRLTAVVSAGSVSGGPFSGTVTFHDGAVLLGTGTVSVAGVATLDNSTLTVGSHTITATYSGNTNYVGSGSNPLLEAIVSATTSTVLTSSGTPSIAGALISLTAVVTGNGGIPTGTVTLMDGISGQVTPLGVGVLDGKGSVTLTTSTLAVGPHTLIAFYGGDAKNNGSTSTVLVQIVQTASSNTILISSANPSAFGTNVAFTANVTTNGGAATGLVTFSDGGTVLGAVPLNVGTAAYNTAALALGSHSITASYSGDADNTASLSPTLIQQVHQAGGVTLGSSSNPSIAGTSIIFSAAVAAPQSAAVTGTVTFEDGGKVLGMATVNAGGMATLSISSLTVGQHLIVATYGGDPNNQGASSSTTVQTVQTAGTSVTLISNVNPSLANAPVLLTSTVVGKGGSVTGVVTFQDGTTILGVANVNAGVATFLVSGLSPCLHTIIAIYGGDVNNSESTSPALSQKVIQTSTVALASSPNPSPALDSITFTAKVSNGGNLLPSGSVVFTDGTNMLGTAVLDVTGSAAFTVASMAAGQHPISAAYSGDALNLPGFSALLTQSVQLRSTTDSLTTSSTSLTGGQQVTLISVVHFSGPVAPTGTVNFLSNGQILGRAAVDSTGVAILTVNLLTSSPTVTSCYSGDSIYSTSTSTQTSIIVASPTEFTMKMSPASVTVQSLQNSTAALTLTSLNSFADTLDLSCAGLPFAATCTFANDRVPLGADGIQVVKVVIDTGSPLTSGSQAGVAQHGGGSPAAICFLPVGSLLGLLFWKSGRRLRSGLSGLTILALLAGLSMGLGGCNGLHINGTPPGTYAFQVTATGSGTGVMQAMNVTLTVTQ
jgi:hypothetical protein